MASLRESDSPQLDHGPAVILSFAFGDGALAKSKMDPSGLGTFLRSRYDSLLDWRSYEIIDTQETTAITEDVFERCNVKVKVKGWGTILGSLTDESRVTDDEGVYEFSMVWVNRNWLVDVIVKKLGKMCYYLSSRCFKIYVTQVHG